MQTMQQQLNNVNNRRTFGSDITNIAESAFVWKKKNVEKKMQFGHDDDYKCEIVTNKEELIMEIDMEMMDATINETIIDTDLIIKDFEMPAWDKEDINNETCVPQYAEDIIRNLLSQEKDFVIQKDFLSIQNDIDPEMRTKLVDWLMQVHQKFNLNQNTLFLAINLLDRYLQRKEIQHTKLQLLGCTCMWIASKYHEIYAPEMRDFIYISDGAFTCTQLSNMEIEILSTLQFELTVPTAYPFAQRFIRISDHYLKKEKNKRMLSNMIMYLIEHSKIMSYDLCHISASKIAAAAFTYSMLSIRIISIEQFKQDNLSQYIGGYCIHDLRDIMKQMHEIVTNKKTSRMRHRGVYRKYVQEKCSFIGKWNFKTLEPNQRMFM